MKPQFVCVQEEEPDEPKKQIYGDYPDICLEEQFGLRDGVLTIELKTK